MVDFWWQIFCQFPRKNRLTLNSSPKTSPHSSLQERKFITRNSLWENPRLNIQRLGISANIQKADTLTPIGRLGWSSSGVHRCSLQRHLCSCAASDVKRVSDPGLMRGQDVQVPCQVGVGWTSAHSAAVHLCLI